MTPPIAALDAWANWAGITGTLVALVGLAFVVVQLRSGAAAARAQATIQFQQAFRESRPARYELLEHFPVHLSCADKPAARRGDPQAFRVWRTLEDLTPDEKKHADAVVGALNDVAQYVADGLSLRSALQQYHTIFVRAGFLLAPYIDEKNKENSARWGVRVIELYNAGLRYHRAHPKHREKNLALPRRGGSAALVLVDSSGKGVRQHPGYPVDRGWSRRVVDHLAVRQATRGPERRLQR